ncbi:hypothetical protein Ccrd_025799 [Cynara cardunculus var. scolymus]|uniref:Uncharacterized protein n=1 Tax=Cynara cardunculus var. scolymus TaxID=59895 RepID=A0A103XDK8_CYNCS|nr:hypothetical protein Ccrd_025799 [Cynara cardunculus var. scolymus]
MHSTNVVFLLFETALNSLVSCFRFLNTKTDPITIPFVSNRVPIGGVVALSMLWKFLVIKLKNFLLLRMFLQDGESASS